MNQPSVTSQSNEPSPLKRAGTASRLGFIEAKPVAFVSHYKAESAMEARFLQTELEGRLQRKVFLDSDDLKDLRLLMDNVRECDTLILLQTY